MSSLPYWKTKAINVPDGMLIVHDRDFIEYQYYQYIDEPYFRLYHDLQSISSLQMPNGFSLCCIPLKEYMYHINRCYNDTCISEAELYHYTTRPVYNADLWIAVKDEHSGAVAATGIAELDYEIGEGVLEWIQVSEEYRRYGLGSYVVCELLWRMKNIAKFVTVSGKCNNQTNPEKLYRKCGFTGTDVWHILKRKVCTI